MASGLFGRTGVVGDGGFTPSGSPAAWWKADCDELSALDHSDPIETFPDQVNNNDLIATGAARPLYKTNIQNGLPAVQSDGIAMYMTCDTIVTSQPNTIFLVAGLLTTHANEMLYDGIITRQLYYTAGGTFASYAGGVFDSLVAVDTDPHVHVNLYKGAASEIWIDDTQVIGDASTGGIDGLSLFARVTPGQFITMNLFEMIFYYAEEDPAYNIAGLKAKYAIY